MTPKKVQGTSNEVIFPGILWWGAQRKIPQKAMESITHFAEPTSLAQTQSFLGFLEYWWTFIPHLGYIFQPIQTVVRKMAPFGWVA